MNNTDIPKLLGRLLESKAETIKLGCDIHARELAVSVQGEDARPLRPQLMSNAQLLAVIRGLVQAGGRSLLLFHGVHVTGRWWSRSRWMALAPTLAPWLIEQLGIVRQTILQLDEQEKALRVKLEAEAPKALPKAVGALTWVLLLRETCDWSRFKNRRQVSSYTGLCPGVHQSGTHRRDGAINRYGNPRVRALLIELVWRLARWQPDYPPVRALVAGVARGSARRKCAVAAARRLAVDLWRLATGQTTPEKLRLIVTPQMFA